MADKEGTQSEEFNLPPANSNIIKDIILEKKSKGGKTLIRKVSVINGTLKQNAGSGGGCMGGPPGREYDGIQKMTLQEQEKFKDSWAPEAKEKKFRYQAEFKGRTPVYVYVSDKKEAQKVSDLVTIDEGGKFSNKKALKEVKGGKAQKGIPQNLKSVLPPTKQRAGIDVQWVDQVNDKQSIYGMTHKKFSAEESPYAQLKTQVQGQWTDPDFPPEQKSLTINPGEFQIASQIEWKRAGDFLDKDAMKVFEGKIEPKDIKQGSLGDCYFLCSLAALAEREGLIRKLFETQEVQENSMYCVWLCIDGQFQQIVVDDYFPTQYGQPAFSKASGPELWVLLMEKAYAKVFSTYHKIEAGLTGLAIRDLTGAPHEFLHTSEGTEKIWDFINYHDDEKQGHIMTAGSQAGATSKEVDMGQGIVTGHAYSILGHQVVNTNRGEERLVQLRNPWGSKEWQGRWSDKSNAWTPELKQLCNVKDEDDGLFWMEVNDFCSQFSEVTTNMLNTDNRYQSLKIGLAQTNTAVIRFHVKEQAKGYIQLSQKDRRHYEGEGVEYEYSQMKLIVCKADYSEFIGDDYSSYRDFYVEGDFAPGDYLAFVEVNWSQNKQDADSIVISAYTNGQLQFDEEIDYDTEQDLNDMLLHKQPEDPNKIKPYPEDASVSRYYGAAAGYLIFRYVNGSQESTLKETVYLKKHDYLDICAPEKNSDEFTVEVGPQSAKLIKFKINPEGRGAYSLALGMSYSMQLGEGALENSLREQQPKQRKVQGSQTNVLVYSLFNTEGLFFLYDNRDQRTYKEDLTLKLNNLRVEPDNINQIVIQLAPGETKMIKCSLIDPNAGVGYASSMMCQFL